MISNCSQGVYGPTSISSSPDIQFQYCSLVKQGHAHTCKQRFSLCCLKQRLRKVILETRSNSPAICKALFSRGLSEVFLTLKEKKKTTKGHKSYSRTTCKKDFTVYKQEGSLGCLPYVRHALLGKTVEREKDSQDRKQRIHQN